MITESLATKYRPRTWDDVVGHDIQVRRLKSIIDSGKIPHAFLFVGSIGCGKTTLARLLATYLQCKTEKEVKKFSIESHPDVIEVNAGADARADDIRLLVDQARYKPQQGRYKIICIDEAQAVLAAARNVLLKPLEEPPSHTIYILGSMEPEKLSNAIVSRCTTFTLRDIEPKAVAKRLMYIGEKEKFKWLDKKLAMQIAEHSGGAMRQAIANLEAVAQAYNGKGFKVEDILTEVLNIGESEVAADILHALYAKKLSKLSNAILNSSNLLQTLNKMAYYNLYAIDCKLSPNNKKVAHWAENKQFISDAPDVKHVEYLLKIQEAINACKLKLGTFMANDRSTVLVELSKVVLE